MRSTDVTTLRKSLLLAIGALTALSLHRGVRAEPAPKTVCIPLGENAECPVDADALDQIRQQEQPSCSIFLTKPDVTMVNLDCCYEVGFDCTPQAAGCSISGRPLLIEGRPLEVAARRLLGWQDARL